MKMPKSENTGIPGKSEGLKAYEGELDCKHGVPTFAEECPECQPKTSNCAEVITECQRTALDGTDTLNCAKEENNQENSNLKGKSTAQTDSLKSSVRTTDRTTDTLKSKAFGNYPRYLESDVKEFIRQLKEEFTSNNPKYSKEVIKIGKIFCDTIDKLSGFGEYNSFNTY